MKTCTKCGVSKLEADFSKDRHNPDGLRRGCRECMSKAFKDDYAARTSYHRARSQKWAAGNPEKRKRVQKSSDLKAAYGISLSEFERRLSEQGGRCGICTTTMNPPCVDHCHRTGVVRLLLCSGCNTALGGFRDSPELCNLAADYLRRFSS